MATYFVTHHPALRARRLPASHEEGSIRKAHQNKRVERNRISISCVSYKMTHFGANELLRAKHFIMLKIGPGYAEKCVRFPLLNRAGGIGGSKIGPRKIGRRWGVRRQGQGKPLGLACGMARPATPLSLRAAASSGAGMPPEWSSLEPPTESLLWGIRNLF